MLRLALNQFRNLKNQKIIKQSSYFSDSWYTENYEHQLQGFSGSALSHYLTIGWKFGNDPSASFSTSKYLAKYKDIRESGVCPLVHYITNGKNENRVIESSNLYHYKKPVVKIVGSVLVVVNNYDTVKMNYRMNNFAKPLVAYGWNVKVIQDRFALNEIDNKWDIVVFNKIAASEQLLKAQHSYRKNGGVLIYDIDELAFSTEQLTRISSPIKLDKNGQGDSIIIDKMKASLLASDLVTVSTNALASKLDDIGKPSFVIPNSTSLNMPLALDRTSDVINICYVSKMGQADNDFIECEQAIIEVLRNNQNVFLNVVGELILTSEIENSPQLIRHNEMSEMGLLSLLSSMDINLTPRVLHNDLSHCEGPHTLFEAAFYSVPTIASTTSMFTDVIQHSVNGYLATNHEDWSHSLTSLISSKELRQEIGHKANSTIGLVHSSHVVTAKLNTLYRYLLTNKDSGSLKLSNESLYQFASKTSDIAVSIVNNCSLLNEAYYKKLYPDLKKVDVSNHYIKYGQIESRKPSAYFDGWWYNLMHEQYNDNRSDYNAIVHFIFHAKSSNIYCKSPKIKTVKHCFPLLNDYKRACVFAAYDADGLVDDTLISYITELSKYCDVYFFGDCEYKDNELEKLSPFVKGAWGERHGHYDFGSYKKIMLEKLGWDVLDKYDEVLLANDSVYLLTDLASVFDKMSQSDCSWWGMQATKGMAFTKKHESQNHVRNVSFELTDALFESFEETPYYDFLVGSYFVAFRRNVLRDSGFRKIIEAISFTDKKRLIQNFEVGISRYLIGRSFKLKTFVDELHSFHPVYTENLFYLIDKKGFPFLKRYLLANNHYFVPQLGKLLNTYKLLNNESIVKHLHRTIGKEVLNKNLHLSLLDAYKASAFDKISNADFNKLDVKIPKDPNLWVFPVCYYDHLFTGNDRALFEHVKHDPRIRKVILTRSKVVKMDGINVYHFDIHSAEAQQVILHSKNIFLKHGPRINIPYPCSYANRNFVNLWHGIPLKRLGVSSIDIAGSDNEKRMMALNNANKCVISSSKIDRLAMTAGFYPLKFGDVQITGLPRIDLINMDEKDLPADMQAELRDLRRMLAGRKLVLYAPTFRNAQLDAYYSFSEQELVKYKDVLVSNNAVLGVREHMADSAKSYNDILADIGCINLASDNYPNIEMLYRLADVLITDYSSCYIDYLITGKPVVSFAYDLDSYMNSERGFYYDIYDVFPGNVCSDTETMFKALDEAINNGISDKDKYERVRRMFFDFDDQLNSQRVAELVYRLG